MIAGRLLTPTGTLPGALAVADGRITALREPTDIPDRWILPGFLDLHVHGGGGADVLDGPEGLRDVATFHAQHGTTALCPTSVTRPLPDLRAFLTHLRAATPGPGARLLGAHLEGPFLSPAKLGAQPDFPLDPDPDVMATLLEAGPVDVVTLAPELPGALELIGWLCGRGVHVSLGHSRATYDQARSAFARGARGVTHLFNAMSGLHHREPGLVGAALETDDLTLEVILDGHHVHPGAFRVARQSARGKLALITDAIRAAGQPCGRSELGGQPVVVADGKATLEDGTLAGSVLTLDQALRNAVEAGVPLAEASAMLSQHPADALGRSDLGRLTPGAWADAVELDDALTVRRVWVGGKVAFEA